MHLPVPRSPWEPRELERAHRRQNARVLAKLCGISRLVMAPTFCLDAKDCT